MRIARQHNDLRRRLLFDYTVPEEGSSLNKSPVFKMITIFIILAIVVASFMIAFVSLAIRDIDEELYHQRLLISRIHADVQLMQTRLPQ